LIKLFERKCMLLWIKITFADKQGAISIQSEIPELLKWRQMVCSFPWKVS